MDPNDTEAADQHRQRVRTLQADYFCDDIQPPQESRYWADDTLEAYFQRGGTLPEILVKLHLPPTKRCRIFTISDIHTDNPKNYSWVQNNLPATAQNAFDVCICSGDVSDNLDVLRKTLRLLVQRFEVVCFCPGNHDLWVSAAEASTSSIEKFDRILRLCEEEGAFSRPVRLCTAERNAQNAPLDDILLVPLFSWYHESWDREPASDGDAKALKLWSDFSRCRWPSSMTTDHARAL